MTTPPAQPAYATLAARLRGQILAGELVPGDRLPTEQEVSAQFQVSRNTAREAMRVLASQGLVSTRRGATGGNFVAHPSPELISDSLHSGLRLLAAAGSVSVDQLMDVREMLEIPAAESAAMRRDEADLDRLREHLYDPATVTPDDAYAHNRQFHACVVQAAHNPLVEVVAEPMFRLLQQRSVQQPTPADYWAAVDRDHREILGHLEAGDPIGAREASRAHLRFLRAGYLAIERRHDAG